MTADQIADMEATIIEQGERIAALEKALDTYEDALTEAEAIFGGEYDNHYGPMCRMAFAARDARAALGDAQWSNT